MALMMHLPLNLVVVSGPEEVVNKVGNGDNWKKISKKGPMRRYPIAPVSQFQIIEYNILRTCIPH